MEEENSLPLEVYRKLRQTSHNIKLDLKHQMKNSGYTWTQFHALYHINKKGIKINELARELNCNASNITGLIDRMKEKELVYRQHSKKDRRVWLVKLTEKGEKVKNRLLPQHLNNIINRMNQLNQKELNQLKNLLNKLHKDKNKEENL
ncbi:MAG: MarR family winged helix-turn-helix transcriptional regulator [Bacillota bacterium]